MDEDYLEWLYYAERCKLADEYKKITGEDLLPLGENWQIRKLKEKLNIEEEN